MLIGNMTLYQILWFFIAYSVLGWGVEVAYHALTLGKVVNRGFLNGPVCPIYGFGMLAILSVFNTISADMHTRNGLMLFLGGMVLTTSIEFFGGWALDKLFHMRWWDYSEEPFNIRGYVCLKFSVIWGLGTVFMYRIVHPTVAALSVSLFPERIGWILLGVMSLVYLVDLVVTVLTVQNLNRNLEDLEKLRKQLRIVSDTLSEQIGTCTIATANRVEHAQVQGALAKAELRDQLEESIEEKRQEAEQLRARYEEVRAKLYADPIFGPARLMLAFPTAVHRKHNELLSEFRARLQERLKGS